ncbi:hypothetical protein [Lacunimicrobium album]
MDIADELKPHLAAARATYSESEVHAFPSREGAKLSWSERLNHFWTSANNQAGVIITPEGLALKQGNILGYASWSEIQRVSYREHKAFQLTDPNNHLTLTVPGCDIHLPDIYTTTLENLHQLILKHWSPSLLPPGEGGSASLTDEGIAPVTFL